MVYYGTENIELIMLHSAGDESDMHFISMTKNADIPTFTVKCCCGNDWEYEFYMDNNSDYERVKMSIMEAAFNCDTIEEVMEQLSEMFEDGFSDILVHNECNGNCEHCTCH